MSVRVLSEVFRHSRAENAAWQVIVSLANAAAHDGITWLPMICRAERAGVAHDALDCDRSIRCGGGRLSERAIRDALRELEELVELETRQAQRGRARVNVYRVIVGRIALVEPDYERLPFALFEDFSPPAVLAGRPDLAIASPAPMGDAEHDQRPPADSAAGRGGRPPAVSSPDDRQLSPPHARASDSEEPFKRTVNSSTGDRGSGVRAAAAAGRSLDNELRDIGVGQRFRLRALDDPDRARAWLEVARQEADTNPAGFFRSGFESGDWPSPRRTPESKRGETRAQWIESSWRFELEDAHSIVDDWRDLDDVERTRMHERIEEVHERHQAELAREAEAA